MVAGSAAPSFDPVPFQGISSALDRTAYGYLRYRIFPARLETAERGEVGVMKVCFVSESLWVVGSSIEKWMRFVRASNIHAVKAARSFDQLASALEKGAEMDAAEITENGDQAAPYWSVEKTTDGGVFIRWDGQWTGGRWLEIGIAREPGSGPAAIVHGCTGTGKESSLFADIFAGWVDALESRNARRKLNRPRYQILDGRWFRSHVSPYEEKVWVRAHVA